MEAGSRSVKYDMVGREVVKDRGGGQTHTGDGVSVPEILFTCPGKTH